MIQFAKMQGLGNDFVVINTLDQAHAIDVRTIPQWSDRHIGIGFDQLLLIESSQKADFFCRIYNADGSEAEQCGNGLRCIARYIHDKQLHPQKQFTIETRGGIFHARIMQDEQVQIGMGAPIFDPVRVPFLMTEPQPSYCLHLSKDFPEEWFSVLSMGNPHAIQRVTHLQSAPVREKGQLLNANPLFPQGVNAGFIEVVNRQHIKLRTYERGAGETQACGSNACAAVVAAVQQQWVDHQVKVELALGELWIEWSADGATVLMTGPATWVFEGKLK